MKDPVAVFFVTIIVVCAIAVTGCCAYLFVDGAEEKEEADIQEELINKYTLDITIGDNETDNKADNTSDQQEVADPETEPHNPVENNEGNTIGKINTSNKKQIGGIQVDYSGIKTDVNEDVIGWIKIDGTNVNYPVVQGEDNEYYMTHNVMKNTAKSGAIFMDARVNINTSPSVYLIYGHASANKTNPMFSALNGYKNETFLRSHSYIKLSFQDEGTSLWQIFAVCVVDTETAEEINKYYTISFDDETEFNDYVSAIRTQSIHNIDFNGEINEILELSTCAKPGQHSKERMIIYAAKVG